MLKLTSIISENEEGNIPVKGAEYKIIMYLESKYGEQDEETIYNETDETLVMNIFSDIMETFAIPFEAALKLYYLYINNVIDIRDGHNIWKKIPNRQIGMGNVSPYMAAVAKHIEKPYGVLRLNKYQYYGMDIIMDEEEGKEYAVGNQDDVDNAIKANIDDLLYNLDNNSSLEDVYKSELEWLYGTRFISEHFYIPEGWKKEIAQEDSRYRVNEYGSGEDLVNELYGDEPEEKELNDRYDILDEKRISLGEKANQTDNTEEIEMYEEGIEKINNELEDLYVEIEEYLLEREYNYEYDRMTNDLQEWLEDYGYIDNNGELSVRDDKYGKEKVFYPEFLKVDIDALKKDLYEIAREQPAAALGTYDGVEYEVNYNGETYYIFRENI
jgi:hypothetical protein